MIQQITNTTTCKGKCGKCRLLGTRMRTTTYVQNVLTIITPPPYTTKSTTKNLQNKINSQTVIDHNGKVVFDYVF